MSVRIYELSKEIGMDNAALITLLKERGFSVKSASSTVDNINADALRKEFGSGPAPVAAVQAPAAAPAAETPVLPQVRTREDIERERRDREEADQRAVAALGNRPAVTGNGPKPPPPIPGNRPPMLPPRPQMPARPATSGLVDAQRPASVSDALRREQQEIDRRKDVPADAPVVAPAPVAAPVSSAPASPAAHVPPTLPPRNPATPPPVVRPAGGPPPVSSVRPQTPPPATVSVPGVAPRPAAPSGVPPLRTPQIPGLRAPVPAGPVSAPSTPVMPANAPVAQPSGPAADLRRLQVKNPIVVRDFAIQIGKRPFQLISELMELGVFASMNTAIDEPIAVRIARNHGFELEVKHRGEGAQAPKPVEVKKPDEDDEKLLEPRPPVVCILGHVDHGKTTLLDTIRKTNVVASEAGGITQHIGAYQVEHNGKKITFIDTPGHAAFSNMRARGANTTDIAILVVAADDGFMPQTDEALGHARRAEVPVVVAINKSDAPGANIDKVKRQLQERSLTTEDWGGETLFAVTSALKGKGIEDLLEAVVLQADVTEGIKANPKAKPEGVVIEAQKEIGIGCTASVIIQKGTLKPGDALVCGENWCRVRTLLDDRGRPVKAAPPGTPVKIVGWSGTPDAGDTFTTVKNDREAKEIAETNALERKRLEEQQRKDQGNSGPASIDDLFKAIAKQQKKTFRCLVKADVYGTAEALATSLLAIKSDKIDIEVIDTGVGDITRNDIALAHASNAAIVGFDVKMENGVAPEAKHYGVTVYRHEIIYELINQVRDAMADLLEPELRENKVGAAEVRAVFELSKGVVAGCMVTEGRVARDHFARVYRKTKMVFDGKISTLRRFKDDVSEVRAGYECGIQVSDFNGYEVGDIIEVIEVLKIKPSL